MSVKLNETGRSLMEMLGVLVVIGLLSLASVTGYTYAVNKHKANVILNDVKLISTMAIAQDFINASHESTVTLVIYQ